MIAMDLTSKPRTRARAFFAGTPCRARDLRCGLWIGAVARRPSRLRRTAYKEDALERLLNVARDFAARFWSLIDSR